ncbi:Protein kinase domain-containing protein [Rubrivivax sp. A210]|nr:serine/threonine-protein kinase [Rubrivivax sp. A210]CAD5372987.1 Protein kinase domain-containing protein [Rubrivivax sp. A210]
MSADVTHGRAEHPNTLPLGTQLNEFVVRSVLGVGGFGIVYLAFDTVLEREVAIKEYMPAALAGRTAALHVSLRSQSDAETFALGLRSFVNEAKLLARFNHPALLKVLRFWEANDTAYMAMPVLGGLTLKQVRLAMDKAPDEPWVRRLLDPLLGAVETLHAAGVYHRDIAPDNIQIEADGQPVLMDFGAARHVISDKTQALTAILKPAYAPIEQYAEAGSVKQGPWTDIYALGATLHFLLLGRPPPPATARTVADEASALTVAKLPGCSESFLQIVDWMLAPRPADRPQSVAALREALEGRVAPPRRSKHEPPPSPWERTQVLAAAGDDAATQVVPPPLPQASVSPAGTTTVTMAALAPQALSEPAIAAPPVAHVLSTVPVAPEARKWGLIGGLAALGVAAAAVALWPRAPAEAPAAAAGASAPAAALMAAPLASAPEIEAPPLPQRPESAIATVVVAAAPPRALPVERSRAERAAPAPAPAPVQAESGRASCRERV